MDVTDRIFKDEKIPVIPQISVFVSNSMPSDTLGELVYEAYRLREEAVIKFILKGFPEGGLKAFIQKANYEEFSFNINVDPFSFETYEIIQRSRDTHE